MDRELSTKLRSKKRRSTPAEHPRVAHADNCLCGGASANGPRECHAACDPRMRLSRAYAMMDERWDSLLECTPDLVVVVDRNGLVLHVNHMPAALAGNGEGVVGHSIHDFLASEYCARVRESIEWVFQTGEAIREVGVCFRAKAGGSLCSEARIGPIKHHGQTVAVGMFFADISEREKLQIRLREKEMVLRSIVRAVPKMMEIMEGLIHQAEDTGESRRRARELELCHRQMIQIGRLASIGKATSSLTQRLPQFLTAIGMSIENALAKLDATLCRDGVGQELEAALRSVSALAAGFELVRDFAGTGSRMPLIHAVDLRAALVRVVQLLETRTRGANTVICIDDRNEWPQARLAEGDAEQLVFSLLDKLLGFADGKRHHRIMISSAVVDNRVGLRFASDDDLGEEEKLDVSLDPLLTGEPAANAMDLGLYVAQDIVVRSEGTMRCERVAGVGWTFFISLPIADRVDTE
jgi:PAS domain S-box-containing protein